MASGRSATISADVTRKASNGASKFIKIGYVCQVPSVFINAQRDYVKFLTVQQNE